ncbi:alpha/beta fold hydrolase [Actinomadura sp. KC06]|uniref:alpha/beta fold hydrolase n=1 Tax=Actinomadura sp. KC06 TaxID=2530369 RepID=UPI0014049A75|nr:alpha/beta fold hydrolase [Actinomadura sp. KC06]
MDGEACVTVGGPQQQALLAVLLLHANRVVSSDRLIDHLWADQAPSAARELLQGCVARLRRALPADSGRQPVLRRAPGYMLETRAGELDRDRFEELTAAAHALADDASASIGALEERSALLTQALALWRGPVLDGISLDVCQVEAVHLEERRLAALEERVEVDLRLGRHTDIVGELRCYVRIHPLRERFWALLMTALARAGRQGDALAAFRQLRENLVEQVGVEPSASLQQLHRQILSGAEASTVASAFAAQIPRQITRTPVVDGAVESPAHPACPSRRTVGHGGGPCPSGSRIRAGRRRARRREPVPPAEQLVRFTAVNGRRVAWSAVGSGPVLVTGGWFCSHLELDWRNPAFRKFVTAIAEHFTIVRYDSPGRGLSDRDALPSADPDDEIAVLAAVVDEVAGTNDQVALLGGSSGGCVAAAYAAMCPDRVERLVLYGSYAHGAQIAERHARESILSIVGAHPGVGSRLLADIFVPDGSTKERDEFAAFLRAAATPAITESSLSMVYSLDVRDRLGAVRAPTLVLHRRKDRAIPFALGQDLARQIPGALLIALEGKDHLPWRGDMTTLLQAALGFLSNNPRVG